ALKPEQAAQHLPRTISRSGAEEHPGDHDGKEGDGPATNFRGQTSGRGVLFVAAPRMPEMIDAEIDAVQAAPHQEIPARAVPEPAEQHRHQQIDVTARLAEPVAAERNIEVVAQEARQRDVPAPPE